MKNLIKFTPLFYRALQTAAKLKYPIKIKESGQRSECDPIIGIPISVTYDWIFLRSVDDSGLCFDGYRLLRINSLDSLDVRFEGYKTLRKALSLRMKHEGKLDDVLKGKDLLYALKNIYKRSKLAVFSVRHKPDEVYIGKIEKYEKNGILLREVNTKGKWGGKKRIKYLELVEVSYGSNYEESLSLMVFNYKSSQ
jgi:hypothetical protein